MWSRGRSASGELNSVRASLCPRTPPSCLLRLLSSPEIRLSQSASAAATSHFFRLPPDALRPGIFPKNHLRCLVDHMVYDKLHLSNALGFECAKTGSGFGWHEILRKIGNFAGVHLRSPLTRRVQLDGSSSTQSAVSKTSLSQRSGTAGKQTPPALPPAL